MRRWVFVAAVSSMLVAGLAFQLAASAHPFRANAGGKIAGFGRTVGVVGTPAAVPHVGSSGSTVIVDAHGVLVAERNAGKLVRAGADGRPTASLELSEGVAQIVHDGKGLTFVADRGANRVVRIDPGSLAIEGEVAIGEPYGLALSPDGKTLFVTSITEHQLVAVDTTTLKVSWSVTLAPEPRPVAVSADGKEATVGFLSSGALAVVDIAGAGERIHWRPLNPRDHVEIDKEEDEWGEGMVEVATIREARSRFQVPTGTGRRHGRNVFGLAYLGHGQIAAPHQRSTPQMKRIPSAEMQDSYGGGPEQVPAIVHELAVVAAPGTLQPKTAFTELLTHQPRAVTYDPQRDTLYVAGYGDDTIAAIAEVSQPAPYLAWVVDASGNGKCGPDGLVVDGEHLWMHCELTRNLVRFTPDELDLDDSEWVREKQGVHTGPELAASLRSDLVEKGAELFRRGEDSRISDMGVMACASCHPEGRQDGLSWRLGQSILQTPMLAGRVQGTAPYKWNGEDKSLQASFKHTIERLGGSEWSTLSSRELDALEAYVTSLQAPASPKVTDKAAVARGQALFTGDLDCIACHNGDKLTDGSQYPLASRGLDVTDTPSLVGLAHTAPYYHDGSAGDLYTLLTDKGNVHDMADLSGLKPNEIADLTAYLRSL